MRGGEIVFVAPAGAAAHVARRQVGAFAALADSDTHVATTVRTYTGGRAGAQKAVERVFSTQPRGRALVGLASEATAAIAVVNKRRGVKRVRAAGFDLLPNEYTHVLDGSLDFAGLFLDFLYHHIELIFLRDIFSSFKKLLNRL